jgi:NAD-dependent SIR2 family protein deacetylase
MRADEWADDEEVLAAKVRGAIGRCLWKRTLFALQVQRLAELIQRSPAVVAYTGAGISTAAGIGDYATKAANSVVTGGERPKLRSMLDAQPTLAHRVLAALHKAGRLHHWVQQNHDGLPQKAGFPPEHLNEIHGAW